MFKRKRLIKRANGVAFALLLISAMGLLLSGSRSVSAYNAFECPSEMNRPIGCNNEYTVDVGYYGCSSSGSQIGCCEYDYYQVYCTDSNPPKKIGVMQKRTDISTDTQCNGNYCSVPTVNA